jgi:hypothetical protein
MSAEVKARIAHPHHFAASWVARESSRRLCRFGSWRCAFLRRSPGRLIAAGIRPEHVKTPNL